MSGTDSNVAQAGATSPSSQGPSDPQHRPASSLDSQLVDGRLVVSIERARDHVTLSPHIIMVGNTGSGGIPRLRLLLMREDRRTVRVGLGEAPVTKENQQIDHLSWCEIGVVEFDIPLAVSVINQLAERLEQFSPDVLQRFGVQLDETTLEAPKAPPA